MIANVILGVLFCMLQDFPTIDKHQWLQKLIVFILARYIVFGRLLTRMGMRITIMTCPISIAEYDWE
ncbi:hypothetical protein CFP56_033410, partial [Quercus suber]